MQPRRAPFPPTAASFADYNGQNLVITIWAFYNGGYKGAY